MADRDLKTDYLVVGCGAGGMAFVDTLLAESDADIVIVDKHHKPGGHWTLAYPFVTLHQPSAFYGVASRELSTGQIDSYGLNEGLGHLASGAEICAYYHAVMHETFLPSGRMRYFPMCDYLGDGQIRSMLSGEIHHVKAVKTVDTTFLKTAVPATHTPSFSIAEGLHFMPLNDLVSLDAPPSDYVIIGGGKTGMDACLWLLAQGVDPDLIRWIMPRDGWLLDRRNTQSSVAFFGDTMGAQAAQFEAISASTSIDDLFARLEDAGVLLRLDPDVTPQMFHGATISQAELTELRRIKNVVRMGRVEALEQGRVVLQQGELTTGPDTLHVDCSASALTNFEIRPIFEGDLITLQTVRSYQPVFSASMIAHIEVSKESEAEKNQMCGVVPLPNHATDWIKLMIPFMTNQYFWSRDPEIRVWLTQNRLDGFSKMVRGIAEDDTEKRAILDRLKAASMPAMAKLQQYKAELDKSA